MKTGKKNIIKYILKRKLHLPSLLSYMNSFKIIPGSENLDHYALDFHF